MVSENNMAESFTVLRQTSDVFKRSPNISELILIYSKHFYGMGCFFPR
jgi:hypothetical protein